jgi:cellulose synthase/poly-beta-1,6-N-acetylglucosamine synthase-like glycosyltransferase
MGLAVGTSRLAGQSLSRVSPRPGLVPPGSAAGPRLADADYQAEPNFLSTLVSQFGDDRLAFIQTRHDYRDWAGNRYLEGCYWEYRESYARYLASRSDGGTALTTGTMCVVRRQALEAVGGWAEWCCTEDSELAIRLLAAGFRGLYVPITLGRGLMPEMFAGYKRQRFRWIFGPAREFRRRWRLFLPGRWAAPSRLTWFQKMLMANHGLRELVLSAASILLAVCALLTAVFILLGAQTRHRRLSRLLRRSAALCRGHHDGDDPA